MKQENDMADNPKLVEILRKHRQAMLNNDGDFEARFKSVAEHKNIDGILLEWVITAVKYGTPQKILEINKTSGSKVEKASALEQYKNETQHELIQVRGEAINSVSQAYAGDALDCLSDALLKKGGSVLPVVLLLVVALGAGVLAGPKIMLNRANSAYTLKQYDQAIEIYSLLLKFNSSSNDALLGRANAYYTLEQYAQAIPGYSALLALDAANAAALTGRANSYYMLEQYTQAIPDYSALLALGNNNDALFKRANCYYALGQYTQAIPDYSALLALGNNDDALFKRANCYYELGQYSEAVTDFDTFILHKPTDGNAYYMRGVASYVMEWNDLYNILVRTQAEFVHEYPRLTFRNVGEHALTYFNGALERKPTLTEPYDVLVYYWRARAYYDILNYYSALEDIDAYLAKVPADAGAFQIRGECYYQRGDYARARDALTKVIAVQSDNALAYMYRGFAFHRQSFFDQAISDYNSAMRLDFRLTYLIERRRDRARGGHINGGLFWLGDF
jgi:tetratricopeptide (TPR) repeat protein